MIGSQRPLFFAIMTLASTVTGPAMVATAKSQVIEPPAITALQPNLSDTINSAVHKTATLAQQRKTYLAAEKALKLGQITRYKKLNEKLHNYPLQAYLDYRYLRSRLHRLPKEKINTFLQQYEDSPLHRRLLNAWLSKLAQKGLWHEYLNTTASNNSRHQCLRRWAYYKTGQTDAAFDNLEKLWLAAHSLPRSCNPLFSAWEKAGHINSDLVWKRFQLAMDARKTTLAKHLLTYLPVKQQHWARLWLRVHRKPQLITQEKLFNRYHPLRNQILIYGLQRLAYRKLDLAVSSWDALKNNYPFNEQQRYTAERNLALRHALSRHPEALNKLSLLSYIDENDKMVREWRIRAALGIQNWAAVQTGIQQLSTEQQGTQRWSYWQARALEAQDQPIKAYQKYKNLTRFRSYYGFLAADRLGISYNFADQPVIINTDNIKFLENLPGLARARELFALNRILDARREWFHSTRNLPAPLLEQAAAIAHQWGWHDRAIMTMARTPYRDDLALRFPLAFRHKISQAANKQNIDPALAFALIRQESAFITDIRSPVGATGLMQLMPRTARQEARKMGFTLKNKLALTNASTNLRLGMSHLRRVLNSNSNNLILATAAYNAGEYRIKQWLPKQGSVAADIWTETIPFTETRNYVQNIQLFMAIYDQRLGLPVTTLKQRMAPVLSRSALLANNKKARKGNPS